MNLTVIPIPIPNKMKAHMKRVRVYPTTLLWFTTDLWWHLLHMITAADLYNMIAMIVVYNNWVDIIKLVLQC